MHIFVSDDSSVGDSASVAAFAAEKSISAVCQLISWLWCNCPCQYKLLGILFWIDICTNLVDEDSRSYLHKSGLIFAQIWTHICTTFDSYLHKYLITYPQIWNIHSKREFPGVPFSTQLYSAMVLILNKNTFTSYFLKYMPTCRQILNLRTSDTNFVGHDLRTFSANYCELKSRIRQLFRF